MEQGKIWWSLDWYWWIEDDDWIDIDDNDLMNWSFGDEPLI